MNNKFYIPIFILFLAAFSAPVNAIAGPGSLDATFGTNGVVTTQASGATNLINAIAIQSDGKVIAVGEGGRNQTGVRRGSIDIYAEVS